MKLAFRYFTILLLCVVSKTASAQKQELEAVIKQIDFKQDTIRSVFEWVASEIEYDTRRVILKGKTFTWSNSDKDYIREVITTRRGICFHYAKLFDALLKHLGYESHVISGYVVINGRVNNDMGHLWAAVRTGNEWLLYDPTWASGYAEQNRFIKKYDPRWFANKPADFVSTHIPFDPLWQFLNVPLTHTQIQKGDLTRNAAATFQFEDSICITQKLNELQRLKSELARIKSSGVTNGLLQDHVGLTETKIKYLQNVDWLDRGFDQMQQAVNHYNNYIAGKNRRFKNPEWSDEQLGAVPDSVKFKISSSLQTVAQIENPTPAITTNIENLKKKAAEVSEWTEIESVFIDRYLRTRKPLRRFLLGSQF